MSYLCFRSNAYSERLADSGLGSIADFASSFVRSLSLENHDASSRLIVALILLLPSPLESTLLQLSIESSFELVDLLWVKNLEGRESISLLVRSAFFLFFLRALTLLTFFLIFTGPMTNMGRVAEGGRNWEGFGGESVEFSFFSRFLLRPRPDRPLFFLRTVPTSPEKPPTRLSLECKLLNSVPKLASSTSELRPKRRRVESSSVDPPFPFLQHRKRARTKPNDLQQQHQ